MSRRIIALILIFIGVGILVGFVGLSLVNSKKPTAGLKVDTDPPSLVYVDNAQVGLSPLDKIFPPGEVTVKLIPNSTSSALTTYQTQVRLTSQTYTVIRRQFGLTDSQSAGEIISLLPLTSAYSSTASLNVVSSTPDSASVNLDGQPQGFTPLAIPQVAPGDHQIMVSAPGYVARTISAKAVTGYQLTLNVKLAAATATPTSTPLPLPTSLTPSPVRKPGQPTPTPTSASSLPRPYVRILDTPTGFLRVRSSPTRSASEVGQVKPGTAWPLLDQQSGWYLIQTPLTATNSGWISSQYAQKYE